jgi:hypothetical protein
LDRAERAASEKMGRGVFESTALRGVQLDGDSYRELHKKYYREALGEQVGLHLLNDKSEKNLTETERAEYQAMMAEVERVSEETTQSEIEFDPGLKHYLSGLSEVERRKIEVSMYAINFLSAYQSATTQKQMVGPLHPAQPGYWQSVRQTKRVHNSTFLTHFFRTLESFADDQTLSLGLHDSLRRSIPLFSDLWSIHRRLLKKFVPAMTLGYLWSYHVWQLHMPYAAWTIFILSTALTDGPSQWLNRTFRMNGIKVMDNWRSKALSTIPYGWLTFLGMVPITLLSKDANMLFNTNVRDPFLSMMAQVAPENWEQGLMFVGASLAAKKLIYEWKSHRQKVRFNRQMTDEIQRRSTEPEPSLTDGIRCRQRLNGFNH